MRVRTRLRVQIDKTALTAAGAGISEDKKICFYKCKILNSLNENNHTCNFTQNIKQDGPNPSQSVSTPRTGVALQGAALF